jgi:hypothetical protein
VSLTLVSSGETEAGKSHGTVRLRGFLLWQAEKTEYSIFPVVGQLAGRLENN